MMQTQTASDAIICYHGSQLWQRIAAIRSPAWPSHNGGIAPVLAFPSRILVNSELSFILSWPTRTFVPIPTVTGRSVLLRRVKQGTPR